MLVDQGIERGEVGGAGANPVGDGRDAELDVLKGIGLALTVQRQVLAELGLEDHSQQVGARPAADDGVKGCRRLGDGLAAAAREALPDGLDDLPLDRLDLKRLRGVLAQLGQLAAAAGAGGRRRQDDPLARQVGWQGCAHRLAGRRGRPSLPAAFSALAASSLAAATSSPSSSSSWSISLRPRSDEAPYLSRLSRAISSLRCATIASAP